jgi:hypothetical protein
MTFQITDPLVGSQPIADTSATQLHPLGKIVRAKDATLGEGEFIYLLGVASTIVGSLVTYNVGTGHQTALGTSAVGVGNPFAVAMSANLGSYYGWYQISGLAVGATGGAASFAATAPFAVASGLMIAAATTNRLANAVVTTAAHSTTTVVTVSILIDRPAGPSSD